jgi:hypothetical protein
MVIAVPCLAEGNDRCRWQIVPLHGNVINAPALWATPVRDVTH